MPSIGTWKDEVERILRVPPYLRTPTERAAMIAAERMRTVAAELRRPDCDCCTEAVLQMERAALLLEEIAG